MRRSLLVLLLVAAVPAQGAPRPAPRIRAVGRGQGRTAAMRPVKPGAKGAKQRIEGPPPSETAPRAVADPDDPHEQRIALLRQRLEEALHERPLSRTRVGVTVVAAKDGDVLYAHNADRPFNPASNTKMLTTAAALRFLGGDYRYRTVLHGPAPDEEGVVHGDVDLRGSGDPSLSNEDLAELARAVAATGVTKIDGDLLVDGKFRDPADPSRELGDQALILNRNTVAVRILPGALGKPAHAEVVPALPDVFGVDSRVTTTRRKSRLRVDTYRDKGGRLVVTVRGRLNDKSDVVVKKRIGDATLYAAAVLRRALIDFGVEVTGQVRLGALPGDAPVLAEHKSSPLSEISRVQNKESNNFVAEAIFRTLGGELYGLPGTTAKGSRAVDELLAPLGIDKNGYFIENGSGLTHRNRIKPSALARLLRDVYFDLSIAPEFMSSLAVAGVDGTIRGRFAGTNAVGLVRAKTGTLDSVSALSGYVGEKDDVLVFSIMVEGFRHRTVQAIRHAQVRMVEAMLAYLRSDRPSSNAGEHDQIDQPGPGSDDSESDGDTTDVPSAGGGGE